MKRHHPASLLGCASIVITLTLLLAYGHQGFKIEMGECIVGAILILILLSLADIRDAEAQNDMLEFKDVPEIEDEPTPTGPPPAVEPPPVDVKQQRSGNLEEVKPMAPPEKETAHVEDDPDKFLDDMNETNLGFAPIPTKIPATSRQLYGDIYSFCESLPLKSADEISAKMNSWGRKFSIFRSKSGNTCIRCAGAQSNYSIRIPQFGHFKTKV